MWRQGLVLVVTRSAMARYRIATGLKVAFWVAFAALFLAYTLAPLYMGPVEPPTP